jgi:hypothetical protein
LGEESLDLLGDIGPSEERGVPTGVAVLLVEVHDLDPVHLEPRLPEHPGLDRGVGDVLVLGAVRRLDLDEGEPRLLAKQDVNHNPDPVTLKGRLEDGRGVGTNCVLGGRQPLRSGSESWDQVAARELETSQFAH